MRLVTCDDGNVFRPGVIEAEIERVGLLRNPVVSWQDAHGEPAPPRIRW
jgi:hypothetical protein